MVVLTIAPLVFIYAVARFLVDKANDGQWGWLALAVIAGPAIGFAVDFFSGPYSPFRKSPQQLLPPLNNWEDGLPRPD
jgi:hypothetical protein